MDGAFSTPRARLADDPIEHITDAAKRLRLSAKTLRQRAREAGLRPCRAGACPTPGKGVGLPRSEWNRIGHGGKRKTGPKTQAPAPPTRKGRWWTTEEKQRLADMWGVVDSREVCASLDRPWSAIREEARRLGLPVGQAGMDGWETLAAAAKRQGMSYVQMRSLCARRGVLVVAHRTSFAESARVAFVQPADVDEAVAREVRLMDTPGAAAKRLGIHPRVLMEWLRVAGVLPAETQSGRCHYRIPSASIEAVLAARGWRAGGESVAQAAVRVGIGEDRLRRWLAGDGIVSPKRGARLWLDPAVVDAVVARHRAASAGRTRSEGDDDA